MSYKELYGGGGGNGTPPNHLVGGAGGGGEYAPPGLKISYTIPNLFQRLKNTILRRCTARPTVVVSGPWREGVMSVTTDRDIPKGAAIKVRLAKPSGIILHPIPGLDMTLRGEEVPISEHADDISDHVYEALYQNHLTITKDFVVALNFNIRLENDD